LDDEQISMHAMALSEITAKASQIVGILNNQQDNDELTFLRIRSKQREIMVGTLVWMDDVYYAQYFFIS
jgi:uncharacterized protein YegJ (DUF2314 family)